MTFRWDHYIRGKCVCITVLPPLDKRNVCCDVMLGLLVLYIASVKIILYAISYIIGISPIQYI